MPEEYLNILVKVNKQTGELEVVKQQLSDLDGATKKGTASANAMGVAWSGVKALLPVVTIATLARQLQIGIDAAEEMNEVMRRLSFSLETNNSYSKENINNLKEQAEGIQNVSRVSSEQYLSSITKVMNMTGNLNTAQRIVNASMGISLKTGIELSTAMMYLTQAANNNEFGLTRLSRSGLAAYIDKSKSAKENAEKLVGTFESLYRDTESLTGQREQLKNYFEDIRKGIGAMLIPSTLTGLKTIKETLDQLNKVPLISNIQESSGKVDAIMQRMVLLNTQIAKQTDYINENKDYWIKNNKDVLLSEQRKLDSMNNNMTALEKNKKLLEGERQEQIKTLDVITEKQARENAGLVENSKNKKLITEADLETERNKQMQLLKLEEKYRNDIINITEDNVRGKRALLNIQAQDELKNIAEIATAKKNMTKKEVDDWVKTEGRGNQQVLTWRQWLTVQSQKLDKEATVEKIQNMQNLFTITENFINAGLTLAGEEFKKKKGWAIAMITLEKAVAIMGALATAFSSNNPFAYYAAMSQVALITAQAAAQISAVTKSQPDLSSVSVDTNIGAGSNVLTNQQQSKIGGQSGNANGIGSVGSEANRNIVVVNFPTLDPTNLTTEAREKIARWLRETLDNENNR